MMTNFQAKHHIGKALAESLGIDVEMTPTGLLTADTRRAIGAAGYYWFPGRRCWDKLQSPSTAAAAAMGSVKSDAKAAAARSNGRKGGRPRKR